LKRRGKPRLRLLFFCLALVLPGLGARAAAGAIVNIQTKFSDAPEEGLSGVAQFSLDWRTGNSELLALKGGLTGIYQHQRHLLLFTAQGEYGVALSETNLARSFEHLRYRLSFGSKLALEAYIQHEYDAFRHLLLRALAGVGVRYNFFDQKEFGLSSGLSVMAEHERQTKGGGNRSDPRASLYLLGRLRLAERVVMTETLYYQPRLTGFSDLRLLNESALVVEATELFSISLGFSASLDTAPPDGVKTLDTRFKTELKFKF